MKNVIEVEENLKKNPVERSEKDMSVLEKLLKIDRNVAIVMALDMMVAGIDSVSIFSFSKSEYIIESIC